MPYIMCWRTHETRKIDAARVTPTLGPKLVMIDDDNLRGQFYRIQEQFATIIFQDVIRTGGMFYTAELKPSNDEVDKRLLL
jgi:hypothetical protein